MSELFDDASITITCPECGHKSKRKISRLKNDPKYVCRGCGKDIQIKASGLRSGLNAADKAVDGLMGKVPKVS